MLQKVPGLKMSSKHIVTSSLKESFLLIKKNKRIFLLIFVLQILFFSLIIMANAYYIPQILQSTKDVIDYAEALNINPQTANIDILQKKNPLGDDPLLISRNYNEIIKNSLFLLLSVFAVFALVNGLVWYLASNIEKSKSLKSLFSLKNLLSYLLRFFAVAMVLSAFLYIFAYNLVNIAFSSFLSVKPVNFIPLLLMAIVVIYFIYILMPILDKIKLISLAKSSFSIGTKNFIPVIISYLIILILIIACLFLVFYLIELNLFLLLIAVLLSIFVFAWAKIYFSIVVKKLSGL